MNYSLSTVLCAALIFGAANVNAQTASSPLETLPTATSASTSVPAPLSAETIAPLDGISVQSTRALTHESVGLQSAASLGFETNIWHTSTKETLISLLRDMPQGLHNERFRDLLGLLLTLSVAEPQPISATADDWLFSRADALTKAGKSEKAVALLKAANAVLPKTLAPHAAMQRAETLMLAGEYIEACAVFEGSPLPPSLSEAAAAWPVICATMRGKKDVAELKLQLLRETESLPAWLPKWIAAYHTTSPKAAKKSGALFKGDTPPSPFHLALLRPLLAGHWPESLRSLGAVEALPLALQTAIATDARLSALLDEQTLLKLKEQLFIKQALPRELLLDSYATLPLNSFKEEASLSSTTAFRGIEGRAALYQKLVRSTEISEQSDILSAYFSAAKREGLGRLARKLFAPMLADMAATLSPATPPLAIAESAYLAAAYTQNDTALTRWKNHLTEHRPSYAGLPFYRTFLSLTEPRDGETPLPRVNFNLLNGDVPKEAQKAIDLLALVEDESATLRSAHSGYRLQPDMNALGALLPLRNATRKGAKGEVVLRVVALLEHPRPSLSPTVAAATVRAMQTIGYQSWADLLLTQQLVEQLQ